ncbi:molecular chaperone HtpG, partial [bacterium]|nr:molecular chaperone HtpG [bacterium]
GMSTQMEKVLQSTAQGFEMSKRILEVNPKDPLISRLSDLAANDQHDEFIRSCGQQFYANALVVAGLAPDSDSMAKRVESFMKELADSRSTIVQ